MTSLNLVIEKSHVAYNNVLALQFTQREKIIICINIANTFTTIEKFIDFLKNVKSNIDAEYKIYNTTGQIGALVYHDHKLVFVSGGLPIAITINFGAHEYGEAMEKLFKYFNI